MREAVPRRLNLCPVKCHRHCHVQFLNILTTACTRGDEHGCAVAWMQDDNNQAIIGWSADDRPRFQRKHFLRADAYSTGYSAVVGLRTLERACFTTYELVHRMRERVRNFISGGDNISGLEFALE